MSHEMPRTADPNSWDAPLQQPPPQREAPGATDASPTDMSPAGWDAPLSRVTPDHRIGTLPTYDFGEIALQRKKRMATSVADPSVRHDLEVLEARTIGMGVEDKALLRVRDEDGHEFTLVERSAEEDLDRRRQSNGGYARAWLACSVAGVPVVPELFVSDIDTLLVTDVKADGSEVYGKGAAQALKDYRPDVTGDRANKGSDALFMEITKPENIETVLERVRFYSALATNAGIELPVDDPFELLVRPDGSWDLITLDLSMAIVHDAKNTFAGERTMRNNAEAVDHFQKQIDIIRSRLSSNF